MFAKDAKKILLCAPPASSSFAFFAFKSFPRCFISLLLFKNALLDAAHGQ
jgi:hypothetical protein